ncbi:MAG: spermidine synthase, partial [Thermoanaerobaculia bacterium]
LMGMAFPLAGRLRAGSGTFLGRAVGSAYAANTAGAILGTALTGFVLVRVLGRIWLLLYLAVAVGLLAGVAVLIASPGEKRWRRHALLGAVLAVAFALGYSTRPYEVVIAGQKPSRGQTYWHPAVLSLGAYANVWSAGQSRSAEDYARKVIGYFDVLYYRDGEAASVAVLRQRNNGHIMLNISGKTDASAGELSFDTQTQLLMGHLPLFLHPDARRTLALGLGGGMSLGAMSLHPGVESIDLLELCPEVEEAARLHFKGVNQAALENPKVRKIIGDGRNHLTHTLRTYDIISSEPTNFWIAGVGNLFTTEFYRRVLARLNPGGLVCQWIYGYSIRKQDYQTALRTFLGVFPNTAVFTNSYGDTVLVGSPDPLLFDRERIARGLAHPAVREELAPIGIE